MSCIAGPGTAIDRLASLRAVVALTAAVVLSFVTGRPASANAPAPDPSTGQFEIAYTKFTIDHHAMGIRMGELCVERASDPQLRELARRIVVTQSQEIGEFTAIIARASVRRAVPSGGQSGGT